MDKIICLGKNYLEHAKELGDAVPEKPVVFIKPPSVWKAAKLNGERLGLTFPSAAGAMHHEVEIVIQIGKGGYQLTIPQAAKAIKAVTLGLDLTLRDRQTELKKNGHPWTVSKVFPDSAVTGPWFDPAGFPDWMTQPFSFTLDSKLKQQCTATEMMLSPVDAISYVSHFFPLCEGDLLFTGTPKGVGPVLFGGKGELVWGPLYYEVIWQ